MKTFIALTIAVVIIGIAGFFGVNALLTKQADSLREEIKNLEQRVQKIEDEAKVVPLPADADANKIIKTVNALAVRLKDFEGSVRTELAATNNALKQQRDATEEITKKQLEAMNKNHAELQQEVKEIRFDAAIANIRSHILKTKTDLVAKNIGNAKTEIELIDDLLQKLLDSAQEGSKKMIIDMQSSLKKTKTEMDTDLPSATNRINSLWHDMSRLIRKN